MFSERIEMNKLMKNCLNFKKKKNIFCCIHCFWVARKKKQQVVHENENEICLHVMFPVQYLVLTYKNSKNC